MKDFLNSYFNEATAWFLEKLKGDGGHRSYRRVKTPQKSFILMDCGPKDPSMRLFIDIQNRLKEKLFVPKILHYDLKKGLILLQDLGDQSLQSYFLKKGELKSQLMYQKAIGQLIQMQSQIPLSQKDPSFDSSFFEKETEQALFDVQKYLKTEKNISPSKNLSKDFQDNMKDLSQSFTEQDHVFCHRDYHSRNLMLHKDEVFMIDFQDAGRGPWFYDLASLLYDSYVFIKDKKFWYQFYYQQSPKKLKQKLKTWENVQFLTESLFLQRGFKACGRFCAFKTENGKDSHLKYLKGTFELLNQVSEKHSHPGISKYLQFLLASH